MEWILWFQSTGNAIFVRFFHKGRCLLESERAREGESKSASELNLQTENKERAQSVSKLRMNSASDLTITSLCFYVLLSAWGKHWVILTNENTHTQKIIQSEWKWTKQIGRKQQVFLPDHIKSRQIAWIRILLLFYFFPFGRKFVNFDLSKSKHFHWWSRSVCNHYTVNWYVLQESTLSAFQLQNVTFNSKCHLLFLFK